VADNLTCIQVSLYINILFSRTSIWFYFFVWKQCSAFCGVQMKLPIVDHSRLKLIFSQLLVDLSRFTFNLSRLQSTRQFHVHTKTPSSAIAASVIYGSIKAAYAVSVNQRKLLWHRPSLRKKNFIPPFLFGRVTRFSGGFFHQTISLEDPLFTG
jgi:hypothetical protein